MPNVKDVTRESWILKTFPEWGSYLNEEIEEAKVEKGKFKMWWLGNTGVWVKSEGNTNVMVDLWVSTGKVSHYNADGTIRKIDPQHQMARMSGATQMQPNLRAIPCVLDPFKIKNLDALLASHTHSDHIDINVAAAVLQNVEKEIPFIGPKFATDLWKSWGVPENRCITVKPGDVVEVGDIKIHALESIDRTILITSPPDGDIKGLPCDDMDDRAVNYLIETPAGSVYHSGDSHFGNLYAKHGNEHKIDVAFATYGENPRGITDKMTSIDCLRMAENLNCEVVIPYHHDLWTNFQADPKEILYLWMMRKNRLQYKFKPFLWEVGGSFTWPDDKDRLEYHHYRGFDDVFSKEINLPFPSFL